MKDHWTDHDPVLSRRAAHRIQQDTSSHELRGYVSLSMSNLEQRKRKLETRRMIITIALLMVAVAYAIWTWKTQ